MSSLTLEVKFIDMYESMDIEFANLSGVLGYLNRQRESDYEWLTLHDCVTLDAINGWSDIHQYIRDNTGVDTSDLSQCGNSCKSSCKALRACEDNSPVVDTSKLIMPDMTRYNQLPDPIGTVTFGELEDGAEFYIALTWAYGNRKKLQKNGEHNAVYCDDTSMGKLVPSGIHVIRA